MPDNRTQDMDAFRISLTPAASDTTAAVKIAEKPKISIKTEEKPFFSEKMELIFQSIC